ncbi:alkaline phosphatase family protein [Actinoallomurus soli]|uniref:alkaline phosphatase family protein n=1 Tax=Actinoallomurus soli TaxID=2952535 RepID=UPI0020933DC1|nr:alkaline phosphatase family protein [Actinoallomurus soli]MCO5974523.1 discoidin domain-containing protein [Actinoallomurus soli]
MQVTRQRVVKAPQGLFRRFTGGRIRLVAVGAAALAIASAGVSYASTTQFGTQQVGQTTDQGQVVSDDQYIKPIGRRLVIPNGKIMSSSVSPDGTHLAASLTDGGQVLAIVDLKNYKVQQYVGDNAQSDLRISGGDVGQEGPTYSPDGSQLWLGRIDGYTKFTVNSDGSLADPTNISIAAQGSKHALSAEPVFSADGKTVYVAVNGQNRVVALDAATGAIQQSWTVGTAPRGMVKVGNRLYVGNEGGRPAKPMPGSLLDQVGTVTASGENPPNEVAVNLKDHDPSTKWLARQPTGWVTYQLAKPEAVVQYSLTSANDSPGRDPKDFTLQGSNDGSAWTDLDKRTGQRFDSRYLTNSYTFDNTTAYRYYRLNVTANYGDSLLQLSGWDISDSTARAETTMNSYGTQVPADPFTGSSTTGTVSVIDLANPTAAAASIDVGLHPTSVYARNGAVFVTNTASDNVSVIDTAKDKVVQTIATQPWPEASVGYEPTAVTLTDDGHLLVTLGRANAVAVYRYTKPLEPVGYIGLLPTDYFPSEVTTAGDDVVISNTRGIDALRNTSRHSTHDTTSSLTRFALPSDGAIRTYTEQVFKQNGWTPDSVRYAKGKGAKPVPVPVKLGDPSVIKHVFLLVKENRTYDQVYGDMPEGNGDPTLTEYGENVTPNQHALAKQFGLYDNTYDIGTNSAEGHSWLMQADDPEYTESSAGEYTRSYDSYNDVLGHQKSGFIWTGAEAAGKTARDFGEYQMQSNNKPSSASWQNLYCDTRNMAANPAQNTAYPMYSNVDIPSLDDISVHGYPGGDLSIPDIYRYEIWKRDFAKNGPANLNMFWFPNDHTGGGPTGPAQVADNDLAVGKVVDTISHSKYWKDSAIFVLEDDSQAGIDHVDGHRAPIQIISPWAQHGTVDSHYYSQIAVIRTIEQILGIHPMNQKDSAATPMRAAFTNKPDDTPFTALPNRTSLTQGLSTQPTCGADIPAAQNPNAAPAPTGKVPAADQAVAAKWEAWKSKQPFNGPNAKVDSAPPEQMNRFSWYEAHGFTKPYPGDTKIYAPDQVPGAYIPGSDSDG